MSGGGKRKRNDRPAHDNVNRPSPHKPDDLDMAQRNQRNDGRGPGGGSGRRGRGGYGGSFAQDMQGMNTVHNNADSPSRSAPTSFSSPNPSAVTPLRAPTAAATPVSQTPIAPPPSPPRGPPAPYAYELLTKAVLSEWKESGRQKAVEEISQDTAGHISGAWLQELIRSAVDRRLDPAEAGDAVKTAIEAQAVDSDIDLQSLLIDTVALLEENDLRPSSLVPFCVATGVPAEAWREALEADTLETLGFVRRKVFAQQKVRKTTNVLYRQANYNLLREESEGYAKLITEYFNTAMTANAADSAPTIAEDAFQRVKALVGSFDLDVGRVLDITMDVFANLLVRNFRYFVKFIRASSWWPEDITSEDIRWEDQGFGSLPGWALPGALDWGTGSEELLRSERIQPLKEARDRKFWDSVRDVGIEAFFGLGSRRITNYDEVLELLNTQVEPDLDSRKNEKDVVKRTRINDARRWMRETRTLPPLGNADAAQLLGFKLAFYASPARDKYDIMPENLIYLSALLIKIGFISLRDLYPHLSPPDEEMAEVKDRLTKELEERERASRPGGAAKNALAMAGALKDDTVSETPAVRALRDPASSKAATPKPDGASTPARSVADDRERLPEPPDQKIALLKSLLVIGALPEALYILGRFPWLADVVPDLPEHLNRILHHMLSRVSETVRPLADRADMTDPADQLGDPAGLPKGTLNGTKVHQASAKRWAKMDQADRGDEVAYKFYWDDWTDNIPVCQNVDDVFLLCGSFLNLVGVKIGKDPALLMKFARIGKQSLRDDTSPSNQSRWIELLKRVLVPALSLTTQNPGVVNEMYDLLKTFPISTRYAIYAEWHYGPTSRLPAIKAAFDSTKAEAKDVLKRISKDNTKAMGKTLSKVAFSSPGVVLQTAINQMESYENLIDVFVECSRYFTLLGYDVLTWCLLNALGGAGRNRIQADGMLTSSWLRALSSFAGSIFARYGATDPTPILQYIANELYNSDSTNLEVFEQVLTGMTGIKTGMTFNPAQLQLMAGGPALKSATLRLLADERHLHPRSAKRLIKALSEPGLAAQLLVSIAQERQMYANHDSSKEAPLKVLGNNVDKLHEVFLQYVDVLKSNLSHEEFSQTLPDIPSLIQDYGLEPSLAFAVGRSNVMQSILSWVKPTKTDQREPLDAQQSDGLPATSDVTMADATADGAVVKEPEEIGDSVKVEAETSNQVDADKMEIETQGNAEGAPLSVKPDTEAFAWHPIIASLVERTSAAMGEDACATLSIPFYVSFWTADYSEIISPKESYEVEIAKLESLRKQLTNQRVGNRQDKDAKEKAENLRQAVATIQSYKEDKAVQLRTHLKVDSRLKQERNQWFRDFDNKVELLHSSLLQYCFLPRLKLSQIDAQYALTMVKWLHSHGTRGFRTMHLLDILLRKQQLAAIIYQCTPRESEYFGHFLSEILKDTQIWHASKSEYENHALGKRKLPGFARKFDVDGNPDTFLEYEEYRRLLYKWHNNIFGAFKYCFESTEYMHIRNAISVLKSIYQQWPRVNFMGTEMIKKTTDLRDNDQRADLKLAAASLYADLKRREKDWIMPQAFRLNETLAPGAERHASRSSTPSAPKQLNAAAEEFQPKSIATVNGKMEDNVAATTNGDAEDGEINDERKMSIDKAATSEQPPRTATPSQPASKTSAQAGSFRPMEILKRPQQQPTPTPGSGNESTSTLAAPQARRPQQLAAATTADQSRPASSNSSRNVHALPARPDSRPSSRAQADRPADRTPARNGSRAEGPSDSYGRLERPSDMSRASSGLPREPASAPRSRPRSPERERDRRDHRNAPDHPPQHSRDDQGQTQRPLRNAEPQPRAVVPDGQDSRRMAPPSGPAPQSDRGQSNAVQAMPQSSQSAHGPPRPPSTSQTPGQATVAPAVNPARLALINGDGNQARPTTRTPQEDRDSRQPRPRSPARQQPHDARSQDPRDDPRPRINGRAPAQQAGHPESRRDHAGENAPTGPRSARNARSDSTASGPPRELFDGRPSETRASQPASGRLSQSTAPPRQQESMYGRLKAGGSDIPAGPRSTQIAQDVRNGTRASGRSDELPSSAAAQSPSLRQGPQSQSASTERSAPQALTSATPSSDHGPQAANVHPSRAARVQPPAVQARAAPSAPAAPRAATAGPPAGTPMGPAPANKAGPPSGPSPAGPRGNDRRFAGLNDTLQGSSQGSSERGLAAAPPAQQQGRLDQPGSTMAPPNAPAQASRRLPSDSHNAQSPHPSRAANITIEPATSVNGPQQQQASHDRPADMRIAGRYEESRQAERRGPSSSIGQDRSGPSRDDRGDNRAAGPPARTSGPASSSSSAAAVGPAGAPVDFRNGTGGPLSQSPSDRHRSNWPSRDDRDHRNHYAADDRSGSSRSHAPSFPQQQPQQQGPPQGQQYHQEPMDSRSSYASDGYGGGSGRNRDHRDDLMVRGPPLAGGPGMPMGGGRSSRGGGGGRDDYRGSGGYSERDDHRGGGHSMGHNMGHGRGGGGSGMGGGGGGSGEGRKRRADEAGSGLPPSDPKRRRSGM